MDWIRCEMSVSRMTLPREESARGAFSMAEQQTTTTTDTIKDLLPQTGEQAYALITSTYGLPLKATTFGGALQGKRGAIAPLACLLLEWCLDWYRPCETGKRYRGDAPYLDSAGLARDWHASTKAFRLARETVSHAGLVTFESEQHSCLVRVHWDAVAEAVRREAEFRGCTGAQSDDFRLPLKGHSKSRLPLKGHSEGSRLPLKGHSESSDCPYRDNTLLLISSSNPSSSAEEEGETKSKEGETNGARVAKMIAYGADRGRTCKGPWVIEASSAFDAVVADGKDPDIVEVAWHDYVDKRGENATDLGHWLRSRNLCGKETDEGEWAFERMYERLEHAAELRAKREGSATGKMPEPQLRRTKEGWVELVSALVVAPEDATREQAKAAWPKVWRRSQAS